MESVDRENVDVEMEENRRVQSTIVTKIFDESRLSYPNSQSRPRQRPQQRRRGGNRRADTRVNLDAVEWKHDLFPTTEDSNSNSEDKKDYKEVVEREDEKLEAEAEAEAEDKREGMFIVEVRNVHWDLTEAELVEELNLDSEAAKKLSLKFDSQSGRSLEECEINFQTLAAAEAAIEAFNGRQVHGRTLEASLAAYRSSSSASASHSASHAGRTGTQRGRRFEPYSRRPIL
jgi:RNA recognition motif-containing protein